MTTTVSKVGPTTAIVTNKVSKCVTILFKYFSRLNNWILSFCLFIFFISFLMTAVCCAFIFHVPRFHSVAQVGNKSILKCTYLVCYVFPFCDFECNPFLKHISKSKFVYVFKCLCVPVYMVLILILVMHNYAGNLTSFARDHLLYVFGK